VPDCCSRIDNNYKHDIVACLSYGGHVTCVMTKIRFKQSTRAC